MELTFDDVMELVVRGFEVGGVAILLMGSLGAFISAALSYRRVGGRRAYEAARRNVGRPFSWAWSFSSSPTSS